VTNSSNKAKVEVDKMLKRKKIQRKRPKKAKDLPKKSKRRNQMMLKSLML
jgi:hypothetical protein